MEMAVRMVMVMAFQDDGACFVQKSRSLDAMKIYCGQIRTEMIIGNTMKLTHKTLINT